MTGVQTCALPICFPVTIGSLQTSAPQIFLFIFPGSKLCKCSTKIPLYPSHKLQKVHQFVYWNLLERGKRRVAPAHKGSSSLKNSLTIGLRGYCSYSTTGLAAGERMAVLPRLPPEVLGRSFGTGTGCPQLRGIGSLARSSGGFSLGE